MNEILQALTYISERMVNLEPNQKALEKQEEKEHSIILLLPTLICIASILFTLTLLV